MMRIEIGKPVHKLHVDAYTDAAKWDFAKLRYFVCKKRKEGVRPYGKAMFVILKSDGAEFILPDQFPVVERIGAASMGGVMKDAKVQ